MTSSREILRLTAPDYGFIPQEWHYRLAELTSAMTVLGLFMSAMFEPGLFSETLIIEDPIQREKAKRWMREVAMARGHAVTLHEPKFVRDVDIPLTPPQETAIANRRLIAVQAPKVDGRSTPEGRNRMRAAWTPKRRQAASMKTAARNRQMAKRNREKVDETPPV